jgi:hypothetical protein
MNNKLKSLEQIKSKYTELLIMYNENYEKMITDKVNFETYFAITNKIKPLLSTLLWILGETPEIFENRIIFKEI